MSKGVLAIPSQVIATSFALVSFTIAIIAGFMAGNSAYTITFNATWIMGVCWLVGSTLGGMSQRVVQAHVQDYMEERPIPQEPAFAELEQDEAKSTGSADVAHDVPQAEVTQDTSQVRQAAAVDHDNVAASAPAHAA